MALISAHRPAAEWLNDLNKAKVGLSVLLHLLPQSGNRIASIPFAA